MRKEKRYSKVSRGRDRENKRPEKERGDEVSEKGLRAFTSRGERDQRM